MSRRMPTLVRELVTKARQSAIFAVEVYNKPNAEFRVQTFIMLMHVAWNAIFLATFIRDGKRPYYRQKDGRRYERVDGEKKTWELGECLEKYWQGRTDPVKENLHFFVRLRNKIEHYRDQSALATLTFGECQSLVTNFEHFLATEFGKEHSLTEHLQLAIQLSHFRDAARNEALMKAVDRSTRDIAQFVSDYRSSLSSDILSDMRYSHKMFLLPKTVNHMSRDATAIEWINIDALTPDEQKDYERLVGFIKQRHIPVRNAGRLKPRDVAERVREALRLETFGHSSHHAVCWRYWKVRPEANAADPRKTLSDYCQWDEAHRDYVYTETWVELLLTELSNQETYMKVFGRPPTFRE